MTFQQIRETIQAHDVQLESCDRDGQEFCDCLTRAIDQTEAAFAAALRELRGAWQRRKNAVEDAIMEIALGDVLDELDATVAKLGLADETQEEKR